VKVSPLKQDGHLEEGGWVFEGEIPLLTPGAFGYTVRVVPRHQSLISPGELGLVAWASG
jgi:starch phosphorylase